MTCVAATSPEHFSNMPYLQQEIRKAFAVPGINQDRVMTWEKQLKKNPKLQKYFGLNPRDAAEAFLKDEGLPIDKILIFFPVRLQEVKNLHNAILALKCLDDRFCLLITAGPQPSGRDRQEQAYWDRLSSIIGENSLNCILRPGTDKVNEYFAAIAFLKGIGASVARFEPFGMVPQESLGNGAPVVVGNVAGCVTSGYLRDRETALAVNPYDPEDIARAIHGLASDEALYQSIQKNGLRLAQATTWETTFSKAVYGAEMVRKLVKSGKIKSVEAQFPEEHIKILSLAGFVAGQVLLPDEEWIHNQDIIQEIMESTREKS
jgi:glycosyltransferase involved in cell wall biosynthesis